MYSWNPTNLPSLISTHLHQITELHPDIWIWGGDIVYADKMVFPLIFIEASEEGLHQRYSTLKHNKYYQEFLQTNVPVLGTWVHFLSLLKVTCAQD